MKHTEGAEMIRLQGRSIAWTIFLGRILLLLSCVIEPLSSPAKTTILQRVSDNCLIFFR